MKKRFGKKLTRRARGELLSLSKVQGKSKKMKWGLPPFIQLVGLWATGALPVMGQ